MRSGFETYLWALPFVLTMAFVIAGTSAASVGSFYVTNMYVNPDCSGGLVMRSIGNRSCSSKDDSPCDGGITQHCSDHFEAPSSSITPNELIDYHRNDTAPSPNCNNPVSGWTFFNSMCGYSARQSTPSQPAFQRYVCGPYGARVEWFANSKCTCIQGVESGPQRCLGLFPLAAAEGCSQIGFLTPPSPTFLNCPAPTPLIH